MTEFKAFWVEKTEDGVEHSIVSRQVDDLPAGDVLIRVDYSSVNYKDALSGKGLPGVTRNYPHTPGIDAAGVVAASAVDAFREGDEVVVIGYDLGMNTPGGYGEYIRVPAGWVMHLPGDMSTRTAMVIGTAGLTAALCVDKLERMGAKSKDGPVVVTGASGGVGSVAVALLGSLGYEVTASSGKADQVDYLKALGASEVIDRSVLGDENPRPLLAETWAHGVDTVGGTTLSNLIKGLKHSGSVAICGLVASPAFDTTVLPFILRNVNVLGVDSVELAIDEKRRVWNKLGNEWPIPGLDAMTTEIGLDGLSPVIDAIYAGKVKGRTLVRHAHDN